MSNIYPNLTAPSAPSLSNGNTGANAPTRYNRNTITSPVNPQDLNTIIQDFEQRIKDLEHANAKKLLLVKLYNEIISHTGTIKDILKTVGTHKPTETLMKTAKNTLDLLHNEIQKNN
jgi:hypothetical protein